MSKRKKMQKKQTNKNKHRDNIYQIDSIVIYKLKVTSKYNQ